MKRNYVGIIESAKWEYGRGWSYTHEDDVREFCTLRDALWNKEDFAKYITAFYDDSSLAAWAQASGADEKFTYTVYKVDRHGERHVVQTITIWLSEAAKMWSTEHDY